MTFRLKNLHLDFVDSLEKSLRLQVNQNIEKENQQLSKTECRCHTQE